jgi:hypothetical protein
LLGLERELGSPCPPVPPMMTMMMMDGAFAEEFHDFH